MAIQSNDDDEIVTEMESFKLHNIIDSSSW